MWQMGLRGPGGAQPSPALAWALPSWALVLWARDS